MLNFVKKFLPSGILSRFFLIMVMPVVVSQIIFGYLFFGRHTETVMKLASSMIAGDIKILSNAMDSDEDYTNLSKNIEMNVEVLSNCKLRKTGINRNNRMYKILRDAFILKELENFFIKRDGQNFCVLLESAVHKNTVYKISFLRKKLYSRTTPVVIIWGGSSAMLLLIIAFVFLRNQIRPIKKLSDEMKRFGNGDTSNDSYHPEGSNEIRAAGLAFCEMRLNFMKLLGERMNTLAEISHDLRTPLTRIRLQASLLPKSNDTNALIEDVDMMARMIDGFLKYSSAKYDEPFEYHNLFSFLNKNFSANINCDKAIDVRIKYTSFKRAIENIISNSQKHAENVYINCYKTKNSIIITIEDDGPGINPLIADEIFDPYFSGRKETDGIGLGLSIARDIIMDHGGNISASDSDKYDGAKLTIKIPNRQC